METFEILNEHLGPSKKMKDWTQGQNIYLETRRRKKG